MHTGWETLPSPFFHRGVLERLWTKSFVLMTTRRLFLFIGFYSLLPKDSRMTGLVSRRIFPSML